MASTIQQVFGRPARRPIRNRRQRHRGRTRFESLEPRAMLAITGLPDPGDQFGFPIALGTDGTGPNALSISLDDSSGTLVATLTANTAAGTVTRNYFNFSRSITFAGSFDTDGSEANSVTLTAPFGVTLASAPADLYRWIATCDFGANDVTVTTDNADSLTVKTPAGGTAGGAPSSLDGVFTSPTLTPTPGNPGATIAFESNSKVTLGAGRPVQAYNLSVQGVNNGTKSAIDVQDAVTVANSLVFRDSNQIDIDEDVISTAGSISITSTSGGVRVTEAVTAAVGSVTIAADADLDLSAAKGLLVGPVSGSLSLSSAQGAVLLNAALPLPLVAGGAITVTSAKDLAVNVDVTSTNGAVVLQSTEGKLDLTKSVTATAGSVTLSAAGNLDLTGATGVTVGAASGALTLTSTLGTVLLNTATPLPVVAGGNITITAAEALAVNVNVTSTNGDVVIRGTNGGVTLTSTVTAANGSVTLAADKDLDLTGAVGLASGVTRGSLTLTSTQGKVLLKTVAPAIDLVAFGDVTVTSGQELRVEVAVTANTGNVVLRSTGDSLRVFSPVTATLGTVTLGGGPLGTVQVNEPVAAGTGITSTSGGTFDLNDALTTTNGPISVTVTGIGGVVNLGAATGLTAGGPNGALTLISEQGGVVLKSGLPLSADQNITIRSDLDFELTVPVTSRFGDIELKSTGGDLDISSTVTVLAGDLVLEAAGSIDDGSGGSVGILLVAGTTTVKAGDGQDITLDNATGPGHDFTGAVMVERGGTVALADQDDIVLGDIKSITGTLTVNAVGITQVGTITQAAGAGGANFVAGAGVITLINPGNDFVGPVSLNNDVTAAFPVAIRDVNGIELGASTLGTGTLAVTAGGAITQSGAIVQAAGAGKATFDAGGNAITLTAANQFTGSVSLLNSGTNDVAITNALALDLGVSSVGSGKLAVTAAGITQSGTITQAGAGAATFSAGANAITLTLAGNDFQGPVSLNNTGANAVAFRNKGDIDLGASSVGTGTLAVTAGGPITQSGAITQEAGAGAATFSAGANAITLTAANDFTGAVSLNNTGKFDVAVVDATGIDLGASSVGTGTLAVTAVGITQSGAIVQALGAGQATFDGGTGAILLTSGNEFRGSVSLNNQGANAVEVRDVTDIDLAASIVGSGSLTVTAIGITQSGAITQDEGAGSATFNAGAGVITLTDADNEFTGAVSLNNTGPNAVTVVDKTAIEIGTSNVGRGTLTVTATGITQSGAITQAIGAGAATFDGRTGEILLTSDNEFRGPVLLSNTGGSPVAVVDKTAINLGASSVGTGTLNVTAVGISQSGAITQAAGAGAATFDGGTGAIVLTNVDNEFTGPVSLNTTGALNVTVTDKTAIELGASNVGTGRLTVNAAGITQSGPIVQADGAGAATFNADANEITLTNFFNDFTGPVSLNNTGANNVAVTDFNAIVLGASNVGTGTLTVTAVGITQVGPVVQTKDAGAVVLSGGAGSVTLTDPANDFTGPVTVASLADVTLQDVSDLAFGGASVIGGNLVVFVVGSITDGAAGTLTVTGTTELTAAGDIVLDNTGHDFGGTVTVTCGGDVTLTDVDDVEVVGPSVAQGDFNLSAGGAISLTGLTAAGDVTVATTVGNLTAARIVSTDGGIAFQSLAGDVVITGQLSAQAGTIALTAWGELRGTDPLSPIDAQIVAQTLTAIARDGNGIGAKLVFNSPANLVAAVTLELVTDAGGPAGTEVFYIDADSFTVNSVICAAGPVSLTSVAGGIAVNGNIGAAFGETLTAVTLTALDAISITGTVLAAAGPVSLQTTAGSVQVAGSLQSSPTHAVTVTSGDSIIITGNVSSGITTTLTAKNLVNLGDVTATTTVSSITGDVVVAAQGAITVTRADVSAPLGSISMITVDTMTFDDGSLIANLDYANDAPVVGLVRLEAPNGIDIVNSPLVRTGRLEIIGGGGGSVTLNDTLNDVDTIEIETGGDFIYYQQLVPLAIDDPDDLANATLQVQSTGGSVSITSLAGLRVVDGIAYNKALSLIGRETGADPGVEFVVTSPDDNPSPPAAPAPLSFAGTLRDMINYVNANTAQRTTGTGNAAMRVVFDDDRAPTLVALDETLPQIVKTVTFDGIRLDGTKVAVDGSAVTTPVANGLSLGAGSAGSVLQNAYVYGFSGAAVAATSGQNVFRGLTLGDDADPDVEPVGNGIGILLSGSQAVRNVVGMQVAGDLGNSLVANGIGLSITGGANFTTVRGNGIFDSTGDGVAITQSLGTIIGSDANPLFGNQIADNGRHGIYLENVQGSSVSYGATIQGNDITGHDAGSGIRITGGGRNLVGGVIAAAANRVTFNVDGVRIESSILPTPANNNQVYGNTITDNTATGIHIQGGYANIVSGNTVSTNAIAGVRISGASTSKAWSTNVVVNNTLSANGSQQNDGGIVVQNSKGQVIGADTKGVVRGNLVTGNTGSGVVILGNSQFTANAIVGNTVTGNAFDGIRVSGAVASTIRGNTSSGNVRAGIVVADAQSTDATPNVITRNVSAANAMGIQVTGSRSTQVGGILVADANYVHSNTSDGIRVEASVSAGASQATAIRNNVVGVTPGSAPAGNTGYGISISESTGTTVDYGNTVRNNVAGGILVTGGGSTMIGSAVPGRANRIAANIGTGVTIQQSARAAQRQVTATVAGNLIESNGGDGVFVNGSRANAVTIGQAPSITKPNGTGNTIRDNTGAGIRVSAASGVTMIGNSIYDNDGLPIVLENGANGGVVAPTPIGAAIRRGNAKDPQWDIRGSVGGTAAQRFYVDIYMDVVGGGQVFMGRMLVQGGRSFRVLLRGPANGIGASGIRATATVAGGGVVGSTSAFSAPWA